ncbi:MAG TPA: MarR family transcriptional regulator [Candidatus Mediterraneibacter intestinavium]|nr:MarR family transcriptional regulator [Candidatus Mediterraneibacter intestinavium]
MSENCFPEIGRCVSIFDRLMKMYYDHGLSEYEIGWGQQFYVEYIYEHPGATPQEMTDRFRVDRATLTKTIRKLTEVEYIRVKGDENDRRVKHLYLTDKALPAAKRIKEIHAEFYETFRSGLTSDELETAERLLLKMADNINQKVWHRMEAHHES